MRSFKILTFAAGLAIAILASSAFINSKSVAKKVHGKFAGNGFAVIELFTSEGCSSCPPADELVARIQKEDSDKPVYILSFHVDYWNRLGWKDPFSSAGYSKRQNDYASWLKLKSVYTPQIVVNGRKEFVGSEERTLRNAIDAGLRMTPTARLTLNAQNAPGHIILQYKAEGAGNNTTLLLALVQKAGQTKVQNGENGGRTLLHVQIVRKVQSTPLNTSGSGSATIALPDGFTPRGYEVIGFIQNTGNGTILAAAKSAFETGMSK